MESPLSVWSKLDLRRKIIVIGATVAVFLAVLLLTRSATNREMTLLYAGLDGAASGEVITALDQRGVAFDIRGSSIFVDADQRDMLRMTLASEGLPANGAQGYELLDNLSGFGTTSQMFDAAYWRAREGELARTMLGSPHIRGARVHISAPSSQPFQRDQNPTAAVTITSAHGALSASQADALRYLVASSVPGLAVLDVAIIDDQSGLIPNDDEAWPQGTTESRTSELKARVERILAARVGDGNAVVEVSLETNTETESLVERRIDPDSRVAISTEVSESTNRSEDVGGGDVTVASNLPEGDAAGAGANSSNENAESRSITNFEISETQREILRGPGRIERLTVAVLVNNETVAGENGELVERVRSPEELEDLEQLIASAIGFNAERGDQITIRSMSFEPPVDQEQAVVPSETNREPLDLMRLIQTGVLAMVAIVLGLFVVRPILTGRQKPISLDDSKPLAIAPEAAGREEAIPAIAAPENRPQIGVADGEPEEEQGEIDPVERLRALIDERREEAMQVLRAWVDDSPSEGVER